MFRKLLLTTLATPVVLFMSGSVYLYKYQDDICFQPTYPTGLTRSPSDNEPKFRNPSEYDLQYENCEIVTSDGHKIHAWNIPHANAERTIMFLQGSVGNVGHRLPEYRAMHDSLNSNIFVLSYSGYGDSEGTPNEQRLEQDVLDAVKYMHARGDSKIWIHGHSLGGALAVYAALQDKNQIEGLILESTLTNARDVSNFNYGRLFSIGHDLLLRFEFPTITRIADVRCPILFIVGTADEDIPNWMTENLKQAAVNSKATKILTVKDGDHMNALQKGGKNLLEEVYNFMKSY